MCTNVAVKHQSSSSSSSFYRRNYTGTCQRVICFTGPNDHFVAYWPMFRTHEITARSHINVRIIIAEPCCHFGQSTVAFILSFIMIRLPVTIGQVLMSNPMKFVTINIYIDYVIKRGLVDSFTWSMLEFTSVWVLKSPPSIYLLTERN